MAITAIGESQSFSYTGGIQTFTAPFNGIYKLECYGARGGSWNGGKGGYSVGYKNLAAGTTLYIVCGGTGSTGTYGGPGGYNGGGSGRSAESEAAGYGWGGGGATHIATVTGILSSLSSYQNSEEILVVAGGGGGGCTGDNNTIGGAGNAAISKPGSAAGFGYGGTCTYTVNGSGGGGAGWYGGHFGSNQWSSSGGGSGWINNALGFTVGGVTYTSSIITGGSDSTEGSAVITYVSDATSFSITYNLNGGTQATGAVGAYDFSTPTFDLPVPTRSQYEFKGWYENEDFSGIPLTQIKQGSSGDKILYAKWFGPLVQNFTSAGAHQYEVFTNGVFKLEVWGSAGEGNGGWGTSANANGGYSVRHVALKKGQVLHIVCGGKPYNGGGWGGSVSNNKRFACCGGGATHIATASGVLSSLSSNRESVLVVAGGGGGNGGVTAGGGGGGWGGGLTGGGGGGQSAVGSQTSGAAFGQGSNGGTNAGGGGGGWYGGYGCGSYPSKWSGGGSGGSGYIGSSTTPYDVIIAGKTYTNSTAGNKNGGTGKATITYMGPTTLFYYKDQPVEQVIYKGKEVSSMIYKGIEIF